MLPTYAFSDLPYNRSADAKSQGDFFEWRKTFSQYGFYAGDIANLESRERPVFSSRASCFVHHIQSIFSGCAQEKMAWIYASSVITFMTNKKPFWNFPAIHLPRKSMGSKLFGFRGRPSKVPISRLIFVSHPVPAIIRLVDKCFKSLHRRPHTQIIPSVITICP